jgi:hypothetical protein
MEPHVIDSFVDRIAIAASMSSRSTIGASPLGGEKLDMIWLRFSQ